MPPRLRSLQNRWSSLDLSILPFLAPRLLTPWPSRGHFATQTAPNGGHAHDPKTKSSIPSQNVLTRKPSENVAYHFSSRLSLKREHEASPPTNQPVILSPRTRRKATIAARARRSAALNRHYWSQQDALYWGRKKLIQYIPKDEPFRKLNGSWHVRFAAITYAKTPIHLHKETKEGSHAILLRAQIVEMVSHMPFQLIRQFLDNLPRDQAAGFWMELMMTTMEVYPKKALPVLVATYARIQPPGYAIADCLDFIIAHYFDESRSYPKGFLPGLAGVVNRILLPDRAGKSCGAQLEQRSWLLLMSHLEGSALQAMYETIPRAKQALHENTLIQLAHRLAKNRQTDNAFEVLQQLSGVSFNSPKMLSLCTAILSHQYRDPNAVVTDTDLFEFMIDSGMAPNTITHNVLVFNSIIAGDHDTAWKIHDMMKHARIEPDKYTYSILLNDAKKRMDVSAMGLVMSYIRQSQELDGYVFTDILHSIFKLQQQKSSESRQRSGQDPLAAFRGMLPIYCENFQLEPLARIIPGLSSISHTKLESINLTSEKQEPVKSLLVPHNGVLTVMIEAYLSAIQNHEAALQFYHYFRGLVYEGDPSVECLTKDSRVWDLIITTFGRFPALTDECAHVIGDMINPNAKETQASFDASLKDQQTDVTRPSHSTPEPDLFTFSIALKVFMDNDKPLAAEKILSMMKKRNIDPSLVTFNTLAHGYVRRQDADMVAVTLDRLEAASFSVDDVTMTSLKQLRGRNRLLMKLKEKQEKRKRIKERLENIAAEEKDKLGEGEGGEYDADKWLKEQFPDDEWG